MTNERDAVMLDVFRELAKRWRLKFSPASVPELLPMWRDSCHVAPMSTWLPAAREVTRTWPDGPPPSNRAFADECKKLAAQLLPESTRSSIPPVQTTANEPRIRTLGLRAYAALGSWGLVTEVWDVLQARADHEDTRRATIDGNVPNDVFDEAVETVKQRRDARMAHQLVSP